MRNGVDSDIQTYKYNAFMDIRNTSHIFSLYFAMLQLLSAAVSNYAFYVCFDFKFIRRITDYFIDTNQDLVAYMVKVMSVSKPIIGKIPR